MIQYAQEFNGVDLGIDVAGQCLHDYDLESVD